MNYYDETLEKIEILLKEDKEKEVLDLINDELKQTYIPSDFENKLYEYLDKIKPQNVVKSISDEEIEEFLYSTNEKQLLAVDALNKRNLRDYIDICNKYLCSNGFLNAKVLLVDSLIRQEINEDIKMNNKGIEYEFIPKFLLTIEESDGFISGNKYLNDYYLKEPSKLELAKNLLYKEMILLLPINQDENEGLIIAKKITKYIDDAFNK